MKRILIISLVALMLFALVGCKNSDAPEGMKRASSEQITDYILYVPEEWVIDESSAIFTKAHVSSQNTSSVSVSQAPRVDGATGNVDEWWASYKAGITEDSLVVIEEGVVGIVGGKGSKSYTYSLVLNEITYKYYATAVDYNGKIIVILYTAPEGPLFDETLSVVKDEILANFKFN